MSADSVTKCHQTLSAPLIREVQCGAEGGQAMHLLSPAAVSMNTPLQSLERPVANDADKKEKKKKLFLFSGGANISCFGYCIFIKKYLCYREPKLLFYLIRANF